MVISSNMSSKNDSKTIVDETVNWIKNYSNSYNLKLVVGISGGVDSALVSTLCCMTNVETHVVTLPIHQNEEQLIRAINHINWLKASFKNVVSYEIDLTKVYDTFYDAFKSNFDDPLSNANSKSRIRMVSLYQIAGSIKGLVVGTGNKIEDFGVGFFTKYGDGGVDISPIADLTKSQVRSMASFLKINDEIINAQPTDGLWNDDRTDEDQLGATYEELEWSMDYVDNNKNEILDKRQKEVIEIFLRFRKNNQHKMLPIPVFKSNS